MTTYPTRRRQRLTGFDYAFAGSYFVTVCVQKRLPLFGHVVAGTMHHIPAGAAIERTMNQIPSRYSGEALDAVMVMPDHCHAILSLDGQTQSLSEVVAWFKAQSTARYARGVREEGWQRFSGMLWQRGFYDRVMRTDEELNATREYVVTNPLRWELRRQEEG